MKNETKMKSWLDFARGNPDRWRDVLRHQVPQLYSIFIKRFSNPSLVEELTQQTIFDAVRKRESYDPDKGSPEQWLSGIAHNHVRMEIRRRATRPKVNGDISTYVEVIDDEPLPDEIIERQETRAAVNNVMDELEPKERIVLTEKYINGQTAKQIAGKQGTTEKAVHSLLYRARENFKARLKKLTIKNEK